MALTEREKTIIRDFCYGFTPTEIDRRRRLPKGTAHNIITSWWLDDKLYRTGGMDSIMPIDERRNRAR